MKEYMLKQISKKILKNLQKETGLFIAAHSKKTGYNKAWIRDNIYEALALEAIQDYDSVRKTYKALFGLHLKHEFKIDWAIKEKPNTAFKYIHARYDPLSFEEFHEHWGNKQNDATGAFLFQVGELVSKKILRLNKNEIRILQKLVKYLESIEYWKDPDNGIWENEEELHASSIGACVAGLISISKIVDVPLDLIKKGEKALIELLPKESQSREVDLALLSLIYPYNVVKPIYRDLILKNVETHLVKEKGLVRYFGDWYYNEDSEAQWVMGFAWLAKIYKDLGEKTKYNQYMKKLLECMNSKGEFPELYVIKGNKYVCNENTPLGWSQAMYLLAVS